MGDSPPSSNINPLISTIMEKGIVNSWSFVAFVRNNGGKAFVAPFVNKETGETFSSVVVKHSNSRDEQGILVNFSSKMGELSTQEIARDKDNLQVVQLESGSYKLCRVGESSWNEIDLGI